MEFAALTCLSPNKRRPHNSFDLVSRIELSPTSKDPQRIGFPDASTFKIVSFQREDETEFSFIGIKHLVNTSHRLNNLLFNEQKYLIMFKVT